MADPDSPVTDHPVPAGVQADSETRCAHYAGPLDRLAIRFPCCGRYYCCHECHAALAGHPPRRWSPGQFGQVALLCGACRAEFTIRRYLDDPRRCPACGAGFNPACERHHSLYFELESGSQS